MPGAAEEGVVIGEGAAERRDGFAEFAAPDRERSARWAVQFEGVKQAAEYFGLRRRRFAVLTDVPGRRLSAGQKRVHFIRHGQGRHNVWRDAERAAGRAPNAKRGNFREVPAELHDPDLTEVGRREASAARALASACSPQLLVTSPVRRAVQTLLIAFEDAASQGVPIVAHELCREQFRGRDPSIYDGRRARSLLKQEFPQIDFDSYVLPELDEGHDGLAGDPMWWRADSPLIACGDGGPHEAAMVEHGYGFLCWLMSQPEEEIAVATHSLFLQAMYHGSLDVPGAARHASPQIFYTGELRSVIIQESSAADPVGRLSAYGPALLGEGLAASEGSDAPPSAYKRRRTGAAGK